MSRDPRNVALVLSGGGAYGAFGAGVLKVLCAGRSPASGYEPLHAQIITGTSVGAFNSAVLCSHHEDPVGAAALLEDIWINRVASAPGRCGNGVFRFRGDLESYFSPACLRSNHALRWFAGDALSVSREFLSRTANFWASSASLEERALGVVNIADFIDVSPLHNLLRDTVDPAKIRNSPAKLSIAATDWITGQVHYFTNKDFE